MDIFLFIVLCILVFILWNRSQDSNARLRDELTRIQREIDFLQSQLAGLVKANAAREQAAAVQAPPAAKPVSQPEPSKPAESTHAAAAPIAAFRAPAQTAPPPVAQPAPASAPPPFPQQAPESKPQVEPRADAVPTPKPAPPPLPPKPAAPPAAPPQPAVAFTPAWHSTPAEPTPAGKFFSLEETLGANWLGKIGIAILVIGIATFLAIKLQTWGPAGKVLCGFAVSAALLGGGIWLERKDTYRLFARGGIGGGWALAFFTTFAMYHLPAARVIDSLSADLVWMLVVAAGMVAHSLRYRSQTVTALAFLLGFATLLTSHMGEPSETVVFSLTASAILAIALVVITTMRHWAVLELCGLIAVYLSHLVWLTKVLPANHSEFAEFWPSTLLILLYWIIFRLAYVLRTPLDKREENTSSVSAILNSGGVLGLLKFQSAHPEWAFWALITLGLLEMALAYWAKPKRRQAFVVLSTIASVLLIASVPFRFHGVSWPVLWLVQAQVLAICGLRLGEPVFRRLGLLVGVVTGGVLAFHDVMPLAVTRLLAPDPSRHWSLTAALALAAILYWTHAEIYPRRWPEIAANELETFALKISSWLALCAAATALWVVLPDQWLPLGWLALFLVLVFAGHRFGAPQPLVEGDVLALATAALLALDHVFPLAWFRLNNPDPGQHVAETVVLGFAAVAFWLRSEIFPRTLPAFTRPSTGAGLQSWQSFIQPCTSWFGLAAAAAAMWVAMPDQWLPVGWLVLFLVLVAAGQLFQTVMPPLEGDILAFVAAGVLIFHHVLPLVFRRFENADPSHHPALTAVLSIAAAAFWLRAEVFPRALPKLSASPSWDPAAWEAVILPIASCIGTASAAAALWVALPTPWVAAGWLVLVVLLGLSADWGADVALSLQADALALCVLVRLVFYNIWQWGRWEFDIPIPIAVALLYLAARRKTAPGAKNGYIASAYTWAASLLFADYLMEICNHHHADEQTPVFLIALLALSLYELGRGLRRSYLRHQGYFLLIFLILGICAEFFGFAVVPTAAESISRTLQAVTIFLAAAGYWIQERTRNADRHTRAGHFTGMIIGLFATGLLATWGVAQLTHRQLAYDYGFLPAHPGWVAPLWAAMATVLLALAWLIRRRTFLVQAVALAVAVVLRGLLIDLSVKSQASFWHGPLFHLGITALILLAALPFAFRLRGPDFWTGASMQLPEPLGVALRRPEQWFFFAPFGLMVVALAIKLSSGHITIAWSLLGLAAFLLALAVGERSFRLAGLALLLVSVAKILLMDVWALPPSERYIPLIVLGLALFAVSFLYTRFSATIRKFL
jgi:uncharacterized membrane protein